MNYVIHGTPMEQAQQHRDNYWERLEAREARERFAEYPFPDHSKPLGGHLSAWLTPDTPEVAKQKEMALIAQIAQWKEERMDCEGNYR